MAYHWDNDILHEGDLEHYLCVLVCVLKNWTLLILIVKIKFELITDKFIKAHVDV